MGQTTFKEEAKRLLYILHLKRIGSIQLSQL